MKTIRKILALTGNPHQHSLFFLFVPGLMLIQFIFASQPSAAQYFQWGKTINSDGFDQAYDIIADEDGNVYVAGQLEFIADFGSGILRESAGVHDIFVAKYSHTGRLVWAKNAGGKGGDKAHSIALDGLGNLYLAGEIEDTAYFDGIMITTGLAEINNMFLAKYDTSGDALWVRNIRIDGPLQTRGYGVTCDAAGNAYICGATKGDTYYGNTFLFSTAGDYDATLFKFSPSGGLIWSKRMGGLESDKAYGVVADNQGYIYVTGYFVGQAFFAPGVSRTGRGGTDAFLAKYDTSGVLQWVEQAGDTGFDRGWDVTINVNGQIVITGEFQANAGFGSNAVFSNGNHDMFLAAYNSNGNNLWALSGGGPEDDIGRGLCHDNSGNLFVIGDYGGSAQFPPQTLNGNGYSEIFLVSYNSSGSALRWIRSFGEHENDRGRGVTADPSGKIYACGEYFDSLRLDNTTLYGQLLLDMFVTSLGSTPPCNTQLSLSGQITCAGACDGEILATAAGLGPFTYSWTNLPGITGPVANGLCAGSYTVNVTDASGCTSSASITLSDPAAASVVVLNSDASCFGVCDGIASATASGTGPFTFSWSTTPIQSGNSVSGLCAGIYTVTCTDGAGCTVTESIEIFEPARIQLNTSSADPSCFGACDGSATVTVSGPGTFTYSWPGIPGLSGPVANGLCNGVYTVTCTDANSCTSDTTITITDPPQIQLSTLANDVSCNTYCNGSVLASANGNGPFTFSWNTTPVQTGTSISSLCTGVYIVTCTDASSCTASDTVEISEPAPLLITGIVTNATCISCSNGEIDVQVSGGTGAYVFQWSNGGQTEDLMNVQAGIYTLCVNDANSCQRCDTFEILSIPTGVNDAPENSGVRVFPNPAVSAIRIESGEGSADNTRYSLYNSIGSVIMKGKLSDRYADLDISSLSEGVYFLQVEISGNGNAATVPLLIQR